MGANKQNKINNYQRNMKTYSKAKLEIQKNKRYTKILIAVCATFLIVTMLMVIGKPNIKLNNSEKVIVELGQKYKENGVKATSFGKDISKNIKIENNIDEKKAGTYQVKYSVKYLNSTIKKIRTVLVVDKIKPVITLAGDELLYVEVNTKFEEPGYKAIDNNDGDITKNVKVDNKVNMKKTGTYNIDYKISDSSNNKTSISRTVVVAKKTDPNMKTIYLTFDDGPSERTSEVLDVLKKNNVKATFFMIAKSDYYNDVIKRVHNEGHTVAIHSNTHNYGYIYSSDKAYFEDLYTLRDRLKSITGFSPNVIRFPGGSSNTVSSFNKGIMSRLTIDVIKKGFYYYDWNIDSGDTGRIGSDAIVNNVTSSLGSYHTNVVLMHDYALNRQTVDSLDRIIKYGKNHGYRFDRITSDTPAVHHGVNN